MCSEEFDLNRRTLNAEQIIIRYLVVRVLFLKLLLLQNEKLTPKEFLHSQINSNTLILDSLTETIFNEKYDYFNFSSILKQLLFSLKGKKMCIAVDEAQVLIKKFDK
jgi:hypothetical protein